MFRPFFLAALFSTTLLVAQDAAPPAGKPYLGIFGANPEVVDGDNPQPTVAGAIVREVSAGSPAAQAGIKEGDLIIGLNDQEIKNFDDLRVRIGAFSPKEKVTLHVMRGTEKLELAVELGDMAQRPRVAAEEEVRRFMDENGLRVPRRGLRQFDGAFGGPIPGGPFGLNEAGPPQPMIGVQAQMLDDALREHLKLGDVKGILVAEVVPNSPAAKAGIVSEDVIVSAEGKEINDPAQLHEIISSKKKGDKVTLQISRGGESIQKVVDVEERAPVGFGWMGPMNEQWQSLHQRLTDLEKRLGEKSQDATHSAKERLDQLEKRLAEMEKRIADSTTQGLQSLEKRMAEITERMEQLAAPKEPK